VAHFDDVAETQVVVELQWLMDVHGSHTVGEPVDA
jgi:hypothetical protein